MAVEIFAGRQFFRALTRLVKWVGSRRKRDVTNMQRLGDRKFKELEKIHKEFVERVIVLRKHTQKALDDLIKNENLDRVLADLNTGVKKVHGR